MKWWYVFDWTLPYEYDWVQNWLDRSAWTLSIGFWTIDMTNLFARKTSGSAESSDRLNEMRWQAWLLWSGLAVGDCITQVITWDALENFWITGTNLKVNQNVLESGTFGAGLQALADTQLTPQRPLCLSSPNLFMKIGTQKCCFDNDLDVVCLTIETLALWV